MKILKTAAVSAVFVFVVIMLSYSCSVTKRINAIADATGNIGSTCRYHFVVIAQKNGSAFWKAVRRGALHAGKKYDSAVEFNGPVIADKSVTLDYLNIAVASNVDGIVIDAWDDNACSEKIKEAVSDGIPVVTVEGDEKSSGRTAYVGPNGYNAGLASGKLALQSSEGVIDAAVIFGGDFVGKADLKSDFLKGAGQALVARKYSAVSAVYRENNGYFGAEQTLREILDGQKNINTVICTCTDDTLQAASILIDMDMVGKVKIIGYNSDPEVRSYISKGVIYGSVDENPEKMGYESVKELVKIRENKGKSNTDTGIKVRYKSGAR